MTEMNEEVGYEEEEPCRSPGGADVRLADSNEQLQRQRLAQAQTAEDRTAYRRGQGRRVRLIRMEDGTYSIHQGDRVIQSFCAEFENITRFQLPEGIEQPVRICIIADGRAREIPKGRGQDDVEDRNVAAPVSLGQVGQERGPLLRELGAIRRALEDLTSRLR